MVLVMKFQLLPWTPCWKVRDSRQMNKSDKIAKMMVQNIPILEDFLIFFKITLNLGNWHKRPFVSKMAENGEKEIFIAIEKNPVTQLYSLVFPAITLLIHFCCPFEKIYWKVYWVVVHEIGSYLIPFVTKQLYSQFFYIF